MRPNLLGCILGTQPRERRPGPERCGPQPPCPHYSRRLEELLCSTGHHQGGTYGVPTRRREARSSATPSSPLLHLHPRSDSGPAVAAAMARAWEGNPFANYTLVTTPRIRGRHAYAPGPATGSRGHGPANHSPELITLSDGGPAKVHPGLQGPRSRSDQPQSMGHPAALVRGRQTGEIPPGTHAASEPV